MWHRIQFSMHFYKRVRVCVCVCVLRERREAAKCLCVWVSHSVSKSFPTVFPPLMQGDAGDFHGRHPTKTPWISCDMSQGRLTHVPADDMTPLLPALWCASMVVS